jgi:ribosomal protein L40E
MDFLEDMFGDRDRRGRGGSFQGGGHHDHHDDDHDDDHGYRQPYPANLPSPQVPTNQAAYPPGVVCRKCSIQTVSGANFCHGCGAVIEKILNCASCGSKLPDNALFCSQCGFKNG